MALGELLAVGPVDHGHVREHGERGAHRPVQRDLLRRVRDVVVAAQHVADAHVHVVHYHGKVVDRRAVGAQDHEVLDVFALERDGAVHRVVPGDLARRQAEADRAFLHVRFAFGEELVRDFLVPLHPSALEHGLLVPIEAEPGEAVEDDLGVLVGRALLVGVFDAEQELAAHPARVQPIEERGAGAADVQIAGGRGGEADANGGFRHRWSSVVMSCQLSAISSLQGRHLS